MLQAICGLGEGTYERYIAKMNKQKKQKAQGGGKWDGTVPEDMPGCIFVDAIEDGDMSKDMPDDAKLTAEDNTRMRTEAEMVIAHVFVRLSMP